MRPSAPSLLSVAARAAAPAVMTTTAAAAAGPAPSTGQPPRKRYQVGVVDFELDHLDSGVASSSSTSALDHSRHLVGSLYYPAASISNEKAHRWSPTLYHTNAYVSFASRMSADHGTFSRKVKTAALAAASHGVLLATGTRVSADAGRAAPPLKEGKDKSEGAPFGAVVFSHGLGGSRAAYSAFASALASNGFAVLAIEHADGTAAVAKLAGDRGFKDYERWQPGPEQLRARGEARRRELAVAARVWEALAEGGAGAAKEGGGGGDTPLQQGLSLEGGKLPLDFFVGAVRAGPGAAPAVVGHSFGAALAADAAAGGGAGEGEGVRFSAAVCLDSWWGAVPADSAALGAAAADAAGRSGSGKVSGSRGSFDAAGKAEGAPSPSPSPSPSSPSSPTSNRKAPLLVIGSDAWNTPNAEGEMACGAQAQERVLASFSSSSSPGSGSGSGGGSGAVFAVLKGSSHAGFSDVVSLLPGLSKWFYGRRRRTAATGRGAAEEEDAGGVVTEAKDPISTARAAAAMTAAFLQRRSRGGGGDGELVTEVDAEAVEAAARGVGVELRGLRVV